MADSAARSGSPEALTDTRPTESTPRAEKDAPHASLDSPTQPSVVPFTGAVLPIQPAAILAVLMIGTGVVLTAVRRRRDS